MNAALIAACAANSRQRWNSQPVPYLPPSYFEKAERPVIGMLKITTSPDITVMPDLRDDGCELRFKSIFAVNKLIQELESLRKNMLVLEDDK